MLVFHLLLGNSLHSDWQILLLILQSEYEIIFLWIIIIITELSSHLK